MDYAKAPNPYDFANPVMDPELFAGRTKEINDISYYLDHASRAPRAINLALKGNRASGKTSVLNKIQSLALEREFCVVRIDLDEGDAQTQIGFFYKIFDSLLTTVCTGGAYGGLVEKTYQTYRNMIDAYEIPEDKTFCPFIFPFQYANASSKENYGAMLSDAAFKEDIRQIQRESKQIVILIFDECDVLAASRIHLEKLRNIFMNTPGFMLVFAGTPKLFPIMDDVFSPIVRQFKKINLGPFETIDETERCVVRPLEKIGITNSSQLLSRETLREIHDLSGGRPYEIQLICHFLFRRLQERRARRLEINVDVLDGVKQELETSQDVSQRPILTTIRNLNDTQLSALNILCAASNHASFDQIWFAEFVFRGEERWTKKSLMSHLTTFEDLGLVEQKAGTINCLIDDFDRIYCKYFARKRKIPLSINDRSYDLLLMSRINGLVQRLWKDKAKDSFPFTIWGSEKANLLEVAAGFTDVDSDPFESGVNIARPLYLASLDAGSESILRFATVGITTPSTTVYATYLVSGLEATILETTKTRFAECSERAAASGGNLTLDFDEVSPIPLELLVEKVEQTGNANVREVLSFEHANRMGQSYVEQRDMKQALKHADIAFRYNPSPLPAVANNLGYVFMVWERYPEAKQLFEMSIKGQKLPEETALPTYNLGIVNAKQGNYPEALRQFKLARELAKKATKDEPALSCLVVPRIGASGTEVQFEEVWRPLLSQTIEAAIAALESIVHVESVPTG